MSMGPIEEELKEAAGPSNSRANASLPDDSFLRTPPSVASFTRDDANGYEAPKLPPAPIKKVRRKNFPLAEDRLPSERRESRNQSLESSGRRDYPFGENAHPIDQQDKWSTSERSRALGPRPLKGFKALWEQADPIIGRHPQTYTPEEMAVARKFYEVEKLGLAMKTLSERDSRSLTRTGFSRTTDAGAQGERVDHAAQVEESIPEALSENEITWSVPGGQNSRDWANGYRDPEEAPAPLREVDREKFPKKDDREKFEPRPSKNPHGTLEPSGRREYPLGENSVPIANQGKEVTSEKGRLAQDRRALANQERRANLEPEARALEDTDKLLEKSDRKALRKATKPFAAVTSAASGQAMKSGAGIRGYKRLQAFEELGSQRQQLQETIAAKQAKVDGSRFRWGNMKNWFSGLFRNRGRRRDIAQAQGALAALEAKAKKKGISDFSDDTGAALRSQAELEARIPKTGEASEVFEMVKGTSQLTYAHQGNGGIVGERPLLQHLGKIAGDSLSSRRQEDGSFRQGSLMSSAVDGFMKENNTPGQVDPYSIKKWGAPVPSAGGTIPEASIEEEDADENAARAEEAERAEAAARAHRELFADPLPRGSGRNSGEITSRDSQLDIGGTGRPVSVGGTVGAARGKLASWEKLERRFDDADLEFAIKYGRRNLIGARENAPATAIPADTSAMRNQELYGENPEEFGFYDRLVPEGVDPERRNSMKIPERSGDPIVDDVDDARTARDSLGDRLRGREEGTGHIEGGRDFFGNGSIGGYRSSIGGYRDILADSPNEFDFKPGGKVNPQGPKFLSSADIFARANRQRQQAANPLLTGQLLFGVVSGASKKPKNMPKPAPDTVPPAGQATGSAQSAGPRRGILKNKGEGQGADGAERQRTVDKYLGVMNDPTIDEATKKQHDKVFRYETTERAQAKQHGLLLNYADEKGRNIEREQRDIDAETWDENAEMFQIQDYTRMQLSRDAQAEVSGAARAYGVSERAAKLAEFNARPDKLAPSAGREASTKKKVAFAKEPKKSGGSSWLKPWTWGASKTPLNVPKDRLESPQIPDFMQGPAEMPFVQPRPDTSKALAAPPKTVEKRSDPISNPPVEDEKVDADVLASAQLPDIDVRPDNSPGTTFPASPVRAGPLTPGEQFKRNVWSGYDPSRHLLPGEKPAKRHDLGPGAIEARFPVHEDPRFLPSKAYTEQIRKELEEDENRSVQPREMIQPQQPRVPKVNDEISGSEDNLRILMERLKRSGGR